MKQDRNHLIAELATDLSPVSNAGSTVGMLSLWLLVMVSLSAAVLLVTGDLRGDPLVQLRGSWQFALESALGAAVVVAFAAAALRSAIPSTVHPARAGALAMGLFVCWCGLMIYGLTDSALPASMHGKREGCWLDTVMLGIPGILLGIWAVNRLWPLRRAWVGAWIGASAGAVPALLMQFSCMYDPAHNLQHHLLPGMLVIPVGAALGAFLIRRRTGM